MIPICLYVFCLGGLSPSFAREKNLSWRTLPFGNSCWLCTQSDLALDRRKILHCNVTRQPNAFWIVLQLRETWGYERPHRFLIFDRDAKFSADVISTIKQDGLEPVRTAFRSPWQNGVAERWVGSARRDLLDHVIVLNQRHLRRLLREYVRYYHEDRTHLGLGKDVPDGRVTASAPPNEQDHLVAATWRAAPPLHRRCLNTRSAMNHLDGLTCLGAQGDSRLQHYSGRPNCGRCLTRRGPGST